MVDGWWRGERHNREKNLFETLVYRMLHVGTKMLGVVLNNVDAQQQRYHAPYYMYP